MNGLLFKWFYINTQIPFTDKLNSAIHTLEVTLHGPRDKTSSMNHSHTDVTAAGSGVHYLAQHVGCSGLPPPTPPTLPQSMEGHRDAPDVTFLPNVLFENDLFTTRGSDLHWSHDATGDS